MNIVVKSALAGAALTVAYACANPVEISGDVLPVDPSTFGDGGVLLGGAAGSTDLGGAAGTGGASSGTGGTGTALGGSGGAGMQVGFSGAGGAPIGAGGSIGGGSGGTAQGGAGGGGGAAAGTGGAAAGTGGAAAGTGGAAAGTGGTGTTPGTFDPGSCDFEDLAGCEELSCEAACSTTDGGSCRTRCETLIACVSTDPECTISEADPLCAVRDGGTPNACTQEADSAGGAATTQETQPAFVARQFVECICTTPRP